jgi:hypothetical protein
VSLCRLLSLLKHISLETYAWDGATTASMKILNSDLLGLLCSDSVILRDEKSIGDRGRGLGQALRNLVVEVEEATGVADNEDEPEVLDEISKNSVPISSNRTVLLSRANQQEAVFESLQALLELMKVILKTMSNILSVVASLESVQVIRALQLRQELQTLRFVCLIADDLLEGASNIDVRPLTAVVKSLSLPEFCGIDQVLQFYYSMIDNALAVLHDHSF